MNNNGANMNGLNYRSEIYTQYFISIVILLIMFMPLVVFADAVSEFQEISNRGPVEDDVCLGYGGISVPVTDKEVKTIIRNARNVDKKLYYKSHVYIMYGSRADDDWKNQIVPTYNMNLCRFDLG